MSELDDDTADEIAAALAEPVWPVVVKMKYPITHGTETITSLSFRRGKLADLRGIVPDGVPPVEKLLLIASRQCGQPVPVLEKLEDSDGAEVIKLALTFFARSLGGGKKR